MTTTEFNTNSDVDDFLFGGGSRKGRSASFTTVGASITGIICARPTKEQQRDPEGKAKTWDNGDPMWQVVVPLQTDQLSAVVMAENDGIDDGIRYLFIDGARKPESRSKTVAIAAAVKASGAKGLEVGGKVTMTFVAEGPKTNPMFNAPKYYSAVYVSAANMALMGDDLGAPAAPPAVSTPAPVQQPALDQLAAMGAKPAAVELPWPATFSAEQIAGFKAAGITSTQAIKMFG